MSMHRTFARNIARNRLIDAGFERPNKRMGMTAGGKRGYIDTVMSQRLGRKKSRMAMKLERKLRTNDPAVWRRALHGDLAKKFEEAWKKASFKRALASQARKVHREKARIVPEGAAE